MKKNVEDYLLSVISGCRKGVLAWLTLFLLSLLEYIYLIILKIRFLVFSLNIIKTKNLNCKLISVGNITVGGTGKTPMVRLLAEEYREKGLKVVIVSRGYKSESLQARVVFDGKNIVIDNEKGAGDEALMLSKMLSGVPIVIGKDRYSAGKLAVQKFSPDLILLDDGFQHWQLDRDKDIVLIDAINPFGYNHLLPRGLLRENLKALSRADIIVISKVNSINENRRSAIIKTIKRYNSNAIVYTANYQNDNLKIHRCNGIKVVSSDFLKGKRVFAFSGIGNPSSFEKGLLECGCIVTNHLSFSDHYQYTLEDIKYISRSVCQDQVEIVITTEKDAVKLNREMLDILTEKYKLAELMLSIEIKDKDKLIIDSLSM